MGVIEAPVKCFLLARCVHASLPHACPRRVSNVQQGTHKAAFAGTSQGQPGGRVVKCHLVRTHGHVIGWSTSSASLDVSRLVHVVVVAGCDRRAGLILPGGCGSYPAGAPDAGFPRFPWVFLLVAAHFASAG